MWFEELLGFEEVSADQVRQQLLVSDGFIKSKANGRTFQYGSLEIPSLKELRAKTDNLLKSSPAIPNSVSESVANVEDLHRSENNAACLFQVASQFNLLEMVNPTVTPENGIDTYERDFTQGPACAIACGAGTVFRNYLVPLANGQIGQTASNQIDCLHDLGEVLGNSRSELWTMENGYALASKTGLETIRSTLGNLTPEERDHLKSLLRIGVQWNTEVTLSGGGHLVSQAYCSALPVAYSPTSAQEWEPFARLILEGAYEATLHAALINRAHTGNPIVYLTMLGGGAFGNSPTWIFDAIRRAVSSVPGAGLNIRIVSFGRSDPDIRDLAKSLHFERD